MSASLDMATFAGAPPGSGKNFAKLKAHLAGRKGVTDPGGLAGWIERNKYGRAGAAKLSAMGRARAAHAHANDDLGIYLAETTKDSQGFTLTCPECNYSGPANRFGASGADLDEHPDELRTPAPDTGYVREGVPLHVRTGAAHALANTRGAVELATGTLTARRYPVQGPMDVMVARGQDGTAVLRHRHGGTQIATLRKDEGGKWLANVAGHDLTPRDHQRTALIEAVGTWNKTVTGSLRPMTAPLQPPPQQTELMKEYGIPAIRALATPATGVAAGPRITLAGSDGDSDDSGSSGTDENGLNAKGQGIYKKLLAKGFPAARALAFAKRSQDTKPGQFGKAGG